MNEGKRENPPDRMLELVSCLRWSLVVLAGLVGAIAVHLIFVGQFLPGVLRGTAADPKAAIAVADGIGFVLFAALAGATPSWRIGLRR